MKQLLFQELYKTYSKKSTYIAMIIQTILMISIAFLSLKYPSLLDSKTVFLDNYDGTLWIQYVLIFLSSNIILDEYKYGTIKLLLSKEFTRTQVYLSKVLFVFVQSLILYILDIFMTFVMNVVISHNQISSSLLSSFFENIVSQFFVTWLILSITLLLSTIFKSSGLSITISIIYYFVSIISSNLMFGVIHKHTILRYNPMNLMNFTTQINTESMKALTLLNIYEYFIVIPIYIIVFVTIGNIIFFKRNQ